MALSPSRPIPARKGHLSSLNKSGLLIYDRLISNYSYSPGKLQNLALAFQRVSGEDILWLLWRKQILSNVENVPKTDYVEVQRAASQATTNYH
jgi:hypothetical protein